MASFSGQPASFLEDVEEYLRGAPQSNSPRLQELKLRLQTDLDTAESVAQLLGTAVGKQHAWQEPFREHGILEHAVHSLDLSTNAVALVKQYLRVIGNSVADNDTNRAIVQQHILKIANCLVEEELRFTALVVMYNLLTDFEPAHVEATRLRLDSVISKYLATGDVPDDALEYAVELLTWTTEKLTPDQLADSASVAVFRDIFYLSTLFDEDYAEEYLAILVHYLQDPKFQQKVATPDAFPSLIELMYVFETRLTGEEIQSVFEELKTHTDSNKATSEELGVVVMVRLINCISAVSASDAFVQDFGLQSPIIKTILSSLDSSTAMPSSVCGCVILGNLATSDEVCIGMVKDMKLHTTLIELLSSETEQALLFAAAGFTRHLTFPTANRSVLGQAGLIEACCKLLTQSDPSIRGEAAAILCKLVSDEVSNIDIVVSRPLSKHITRASLPGVDVPEEPTILYHIVAQALAPSAPLPSTTMKNPMIELGRTIVAILRYLRQSNPTGDTNTEKYMQAVFKIPAVARPVARLVRQRFYADARAEGLLGLGLMAQSQEGAGCVIDELQADEGLLGAIKEFANESTEGKQSDAAAGRDYQNAVVLLHGLAKNGTAKMDGTLNSDVTALQAELSKLMVQ